MTEFSELMQGVRRDGAAWQVSVSDDWIQGRTIYGGLDAAICLETAQREFADLPPLRSAQFAFIGPATGKLRMTPSELRRGKSTVFAGVDQLPAPLDAEPLHPDPDARDWYLSQRSAYRELYRALRPLTTPAGHTSRSTT